MKTVFKVDDGGDVTMTFDGYDHEGQPVRVKRIFTCPHDGGYVREVLRDGSTRQVCERLSSAGSTLRCHSNMNLITLIRRQYAAKRRQAKRNDWPMA